MSKLIDGIVFGEMLKAGLYNLKRNIETVNDLNVFPIPDGDTGDNMYATMLGGVKTIKSDDDVLGNVAKLVGEGMLLGARGNSGVILSQMFAGITKVFAEHEKADVQILSDAFKTGVAYAYASVMEPVEGTMLTVLREATEYATEKIDQNSTVVSFISDYLEQTKASVKRTPELLYVLKEAGVVDSGGEGVYYIIEGFLKALKGEKLNDVPISVQEQSKSIDYSLFNEDSVMEFGYCTEFLLQLTRAKTNIDEFSLDDVKKRLGEFGDSLVAVKNGTIVKIHVHTLTPGAVLEYAQSFGEFLTLKIENMTLQHNETSEKKDNVEFKKNLTRKQFGIITVANGEGLMSTFKELGADVVIDGGQGKNPSVEVFLKAFDAVNSDTIFVIPNNGNIMMAAKESAKLYKESDVRVINAKTLGDGYAVLGALDIEGKTTDQIVMQMENDILSSTSIMVSKANRDTRHGEIDVKEGNYIGFEDKEILVSDSDKVSCAIALMKEKCADEKEFVVAFYGADVSETDKEKFELEVSKNFPDAEFYALSGDQEIYDFVIILQ